MSHRRADADRRLVVLGGGGDRKGRVWLVGAGPGDPELLTVKAARLIREADVIVHDRLIGAEVLALAAPKARLIDVGKRRSRHTLPQDDINQLLVALAQEGLDVVRLKGGDPFIFGRGGEELAALAAAGIAAQVVPGVTAALAAGAVAGTPLTHRGLAQAVTFVTAHGAGDRAPDLDYRALASRGQTLAIYMGVSTCAALASALIAAGREPSTPVLAVENASLPSGRRVRAALGSIAEAVKGFEGPTLLIVGEVAALALVSADDELADVCAVAAEGVRA